jgi:hypothetical protein
MPDQSVLPMHMLPCSHSAVEHTWSKDMKGIETAVRHDGMYIFIPSELRFTDIFTWRWEVRERRGLVIIDADRRSSYQIPDGPTGSKVVHKFIPMHFVKVTNIML